MSCTACSHELTDTSCMVTVMMIYTYIYIWWCLESQLFIAIAFCHTLSVVSSGMCDKCGLISLALLLDLVSSIYTILILRRV